MYAAAPCVDHLLLTTMLSLPPAYPCFFCLLEHSEQLFKSLEKAKDMDAFTIERGMHFIQAFFWLLSS